MFPAAKLGIKNGMHPTLFTEEIIKITENPIIKSSKKSESNNREEFEDKDIELNKGELNMIYDNSSNKINKKSVLKLSSTQ